MVVVTCCTKAQMLGFVDKFGKLVDLGLKEVGGGKETPRAATPESEGSRKSSPSVSPSSQSDISSSRACISARVGTC